MIGEEPVNTLSHSFIPPAPPGWDAATSWDNWPSHIPPTLPPFRLADASGSSRHQTAVRLCYDAHALYVRFDCADRDIWGTLTQRDDPIYNEEVVELFIASGSETPTEYAELEISPNGVLFDAWVQNPTGDRAQMVVDTAWNWPGIRWSVQRMDHHNHWRANLLLPWAGIVPSGPLPTVWRANFYRIERPRNAAPEFSCWSPTLTDPADFHRPERFGTLQIETA
jgi:hypothetical protein